MSQVKKRGEVWVFTEQEDGLFAPVGFELLAKGRALADRLGVRLGALLLGEDVGKFAGELIARGADRVYVADHGLLGHYQCSSYAKVVTRLVREHDPQILLFGATPIGRDLAPRVASACQTGLTADCTDLEIGDYRDPQTGQVHEGMLFQSSPAYGGTAVATVVTLRRPQMATMRPGMNPLGQPDPGRRGKVVEAPVQLSSLDTSLRVILRVREPRPVDLRSARIVVAGGAGLGGEQGFAQVRELASVLGGVVGATRAAVDAGWARPEELIGQSGVAVRPMLYIAAGISGALQHRVGMHEASRIVAINRDPQAPIFRMAHYGLLGDVQEVLPQMIHAIRGWR